MIWAGVSRTIIWTPWIVEAGVPHQQEYYTTGGDGLHRSPSAPQDLGDPDDPTHREREKTDHHEPHSFLEPFHSALLMISYTTVDRPLHGSLGAEAPRNCAILTPG